MSNQCQGVFTQSTYFYENKCQGDQCLINVRVKQVEFPNDGFTMDLPKQMALSTIAVRTLYINYDFWSSCCSTFTYKPLKKITVPEVVEVES